MAASVLECTIVNIQFTCIITVICKSYTIIHVITINKIREYSLCDDIDTTII